MKITRRNFFKASSGTLAASVLPVNALTVAIDKEKTDLATGNNLEVIEGLLAIGLWKLAREICFTAS